MIALKTFADVIDQEKLELLHSEKKDTLLVQQNKQTIAMVEFKKTNSVRSDTEKNVPLSLCYLALDKISHTIHMMLM